MSNSWRKYGGRSVLLNETINVGTVVANQFLTRSTDSTTNTFDNIHVLGEAHVEYDTYLNRDLYVKHNEYISNNLYLQNNLKFGIDISKDNLENRFNGACTRFLNHRREYKNMPYALFVNGNSSQNIRNGSAMLNDKAIQITNAVFGNGPNDKEIIGPGVARQFRSEEHTSELQSH